jgi:hypothetical protein
VADCTWSEDVLRGEAGRFTALLNTWQTSCLDVNPLPCRYFLSVADREPLYDDIMRISPNAVPPIYFHGNYTTYKLYYIQTILHTNYTTYKLYYIQTILHTKSTITLFDRAKS